MSHCAQIWDAEPGCAHEEWSSETRSGETYDTKTGSVGCAIRAAGKNSIVTVSTQTCAKCGAWRGSFGQEPTIQMYVAHSVDILSEIWRVLRQDGLCFWNIGDSYIKKDLALIPFRVALAAQQAGWLIRSVIIWDKADPMPESVMDRPTDGYEYILMLAKSKRYFYDREATRESHIMRNVWNFPTAAFPGAHFATPPELPTRCIKVATSEHGVCGQCGKQHERVVEPTPEYASKLLESSSEKWYQRTVSPFPVGKKSGKHLKGHKHADYITIGWRATCECNAGIVPATVCDPFSGSGTTALVARQMGRQAIGIDTSEKYLMMTQDRIRQHVLL